MEEQCRLQKKTSPGAQVERRPAAFSLLLSPGPPASSGGMVPPLSSTGIRKLLFRIFPKKRFSHLRGSSQNVTAEMSLDEQRVDYALLGNKPSWEEKVVQTFRTLSTRSCLSNTMLCP